MRVARRRRKTKPSDDSWPPEGFPNLVARRRRKLRLAHNQKLPYQAVILKLLYGAFRENHFVPTTPHCAATELALGAQSALLVVRLVQNRIL
ncbi:MAG: hypothetical protein WBE97_00725, partial [Candidatus Acidiferrales bacterium]